MQVVALDRFHLLESPVQGKLSRCDPTLAKALIEALLRLHLAEHLLLVTTMRQWAHILGHYNHPHNKLFKHHPKE
jgi:hypothetical protein